MAVAVWAAAARAINGLVMPEARLCKDDFDMVFWE